MSKENKSKLTIAGIVLGMAVSILSILAYGNNFVNAQRQLEHRLTKTETQVEGMNDRLERIEDKLDQILRRTP